MGAVPAIGMRRSGRVCRIFADECGRKPVDPFGDTRWHAVGAGFADTDQPLVGVDPHNSAIGLDRAVAGSDPLPFRLVHAREAYCVEGGNSHLDPLHQGNLYDGSLT